MKIPQDLSGMFWLPEAPEHKVAGHLLSGSGTIRLDLHGTFPGFEGLPGGRAHPIVLGVGDGSQLLTLHGAYSSGSHVGAFMRQQLSIGHGFIGAHFTQEELTFSELEFATDHLADWVAGSGFIHTLPPPEGLRWQVGFRHPDPSVAQLGNDGTIKLAFEGGMHVEQGRVELTEAPRIVATATSPIGYRELVTEFLSPLRDLLTFATSSPAYLENVVVRGSRAIHRMPSGMEHEVDIHFVHDLLQPEERDRVVGRLRPNRMLFALADWPGDFAHLIGRWLELSRRHESSLNLLMGLSYAPPRWEATRVLTLAQALEAYHRTNFEASPATKAAIERKQRVLSPTKPVLSPDDWHWLESKLQHAEDPTLRKRLHDCASRVAAVIEPMVTDLDAFTDGLSEVRHTYSHFGAGGSGTESARRDYELGRRASWVLVANYLLDLGFTSEGARSLVARNQVFQHDLKPEWIDC